jgi:hypothetical protein
MPYPQFRAGMVPTADEIEALKAIWVIKEQNEDRTSTISLSNDLELFLFLEANARYHIRCVFQMDGPAGGVVAGGQGIVTDWSIPVDSVLTMLKRTLGPDAASTDRQNTNMRVGAHNAATDITYGIEDDDTFWGTAMEEFIIETVSAGTINFRWAQKTSHATAVSVRSGSYIRAELIG